MSLKHRKDFSFSLTVHFLKSVGVWLSSTRGEEIFRNATVVYTIIAHVFSMWVQFRNLYFLWGDFSLSAYIICDTIPLFVDVFKLLVVYAHKEKFLNLVVYMRKNFWHHEYDKYEDLIFLRAKRMSTYFVCIFSFFLQATDVTYVIRPIVSNIGKNVSERTLIFNMWLDPPITVTPYYEIAYVIQVLALYQACACYQSFDNIFCILCLHVASQFRILQYRVAEMPGIKMAQDKGATIITSRRCYTALKRCIQQHQTLIELCSTLEEVFRVITLGQVTVYSALISFIGYQLVMADLDPTFRVSFTSYLLMTICQMWMFTYSCDCVTRESSNVATAVYTGPWIHLSMDEFGRAMRKDLQIVMMRCKQPCYLTASGFFPISLETYTKIMSTAMSYFTIMKQRNVDE